MIRADLTVLQESVQIARRKELYLELFPETKQGSKGGWHNNKTEKLETVNVTVSSLETTTDPPLAFVPDTAAKTNKSRETVSRRARIGTELADVADQLESTPIADNQRCHVDIFA